MLGQFDLYSYLRFVFSSIFANFVVIAILVGTVVMAFGTVYTLVRRDVGIKVLVSGGVLIAIFVSLAAQQFGAIPVTFDGVAKLGLATFPAGPVMAAYHTTVNYILYYIGWGASILMLVGGAMFLASRGGNSSVTMLLLGTVMTGIGSLIGTGGMITWIMGFIGVNVPVMA